MAVAAASSSSHIMVNPLLFHTAARSLCPPVNVLLYSIANSFRTRPCDPKPCKTTRRRVYVALFVFVFFFCLSFVCDGYQGKRVSGVSGWIGFRSGIGWGWQTGQSVCERMGQEPPHKGVDGTQKMLGTLVLLLLLLLLPGLVSLGSFGN